MLPSTLILAVLPWLAVALPADGQSALAVRQGCGSDMRPCGGGCIPAKLKCGQHVSDE
ncbi:hypothetical protein Slin15195_G096380 [Septoria linicola]|uniref:Uncharacterized protein n=1 Tax=Septoria linicola TaxID=215465 RepID=A0A9Q9AWL3_9PEZI|nr:hypothetical protein Slin14017_G059470 [Septoria linicola]USW56319.1 hypothetical protein Slin15195_G096380 [Septoria linicola]